MRKRQKRMMVLATITVFMATALFFPGPVGAGDMEPPGPPGSTMKTLDQIPPTWSQIIPGSERFELVMGGAAVLDKETGLVWEQSPDTTKRTWTSACSHCYQKEVANRKGWRTPTIEELASLVDNDNSPLALPTNHPFSNVQMSFYWSSATVAGSTGYAWYVYFYGGGFVGSRVKGGSNYVWCVRGGHGHDAY
jgi:hypothetical protein